MRPAKSSLTVVPLIVASLMVAAPALAQIPQEFTNLQVLPKEISRAELINLMRTYSADLGVRCNHCHVGTDQTSAFSDFDFASDDKGHKRIARIMMKMTDEINANYIAEAAHHGTAEVTCATCHHGQARPSTLQAQLMKAFDDGGASALTTRYGELRGELYGRGVYDFGESSLIAVATVLARERKDLAAAGSVLELNLEHYPDSFMTWYSMGELRSMGQDPAGALDAFREALAIDPENEWAKKAVERLEQ